MLSEDTINTIIKNTGEHRYQILREYTEWQEWCNKVESEGDEYSPFDATI